MRALTNGGKCDDRAKRCSDKCGCKLYKEWCVVQKNGTTGNKRADIPPWVVGYPSHSPCSAVLLVESAWMAWSGPHSGSAKLEVPTDARKPWLRWAALVTVVCTSGRHLSPRYTRHPIELEASHLPTRIPILQPAHWRHALARARVGQFPSTTGVRARRRLVAVHSPLTRAFAGSKLQCPSFVPAHDIQVVHLVVARPRSSERGARWVGIQFRQSRASLSRTPNRKDCHDRQITGGAQ